MGTMTTMIDHDSPGAPKPVPESLLLWHKLLGELAALLQEADDKLDEYGEPEKSALRGKIREIVRYARDTRREMEGGI
jgi:hypothetical protein